jgi:hypothetical protein
LGQLIKTLEKSGYGLTHTVALSLYFHDIPFDEWLGSAG